VPLITVGRRQARNVATRPSSVVPVGQTLAAVTAPTEGTAVQRAPAPPNSAEVELQVQPWNAVSVGPLSAPT